MRLILVLAAFAGGAAPLPADDAVTITVRRETVGDAVKVTKTTNDEATTTVSANGQDQTKVEKKQTKFVYVKKPLARPDGAKRATKLTRAYETAVRTTGEDAAKLPFEGKEVLIEKKDKKYAFTTGGEALTGTDIEELANEFNKKGDEPIVQEDFLPKTPVKLNAAWMLEGAKIAKSFSEETPFEADPDKTKASGTLTKVYEKGGKKFGVIELKINVVPTGLKQGNQVLPLKDGCKIDVDVTMDVCIDGSVTEGTITQKMTMDIKADIQGNLLAVAVKGVNKVEAVPVKK